MIFSKNYIFRYVTLIAALCCIMAFPSCEDESFTSNPSAKVSFSTDTVSFDTVFTALPSSTKRLMVYNKTGDNIRINKVELRSSTNCFHVNLNGRSGDSFSDVEIMSGDSLHIFINVNVSELNSDSPVQILDSLVFIYNGNTQNVKLSTYGQDVKTLRKAVISENTTFTRERPYLIYDTLTVKEGVTLEIESGTKLYFTNKATLEVHGTLIAKGLSSHPVLIQGSRLDYLMPEIPYNRVPNQWGGIRFCSESSNNIISGTIIKGGNFGIAVDSAAIDSSAYRLTIENSTITCAKRGVLNVSNANVYAYNTLFANGGNTTISLNGGLALFNHCTIAEYSASGRRYNSALGLHSYNNEIPLYAEFNNSIVYGSYHQEIKTEESDLVSFRFNHCLLKAAQSDSANFVNVIWNEDPMFKMETSKYLYDFSADSLSPMVNAGDTLIRVKYPDCQYDINGNSRDSLPDIGAYEFVCLNKPEEP